MKTQLALIWIAAVALISSALADEIHNAAASGDVEKIKQLLNMNAGLVDEGDPSLMGMTPLHVAAEKGQTAVVGLLLERGAKADPVWALNGMTPLVFSARANQPDIVRLLLAKGANPNRIANGTTALHSAARSGYTEVVQILLDNGADVNLRDPEGRTPLHLVAATGKKEIAELLISRGADVNAKDNKGNVAWNLTVKRSDIAEVLRKRGAVGAEPIADLIVNDGARFCRSKEVVIDPISDRFPTIRMTDMHHPEAEPIILNNPGKPFKFVLPDHGDGDYVMMFQFLDGTGRPQGPVLMRSITLDTIPPLVKIINPVNNSTIDQGFVHVQATVFDPAPDDLTKPGINRPLAVWVNGERYWNLHGPGIDVPRYLVQDGSNRLSIVAIDRASNRTETVVNWTVNLDRDKTAPTLSQFDLRPDKTGKVVFPDDPEILVQGHLDDPNAIVMATVNGGEPIKMNVRDDMFGYLIPLSMGENKLVLSAIDGAGNSRDYHFTIVRSNRYRLKITSPPRFGFYANGVPPIVKGYVSALRDAGTKNEARLVGAFVNGIPTVLGAPDADGNVAFTTSQPVPVPVDPGGRPTALDVEVHWSDGLIYY